MTEELKQKAEEVTNRFVKMIGYEDSVMVKRISEAVQYGFEKGATEATKTVVVEHFEAYGQCRDSRRIADLENQVEQMKKCLKGIIYMAESGLHTKNELAFARLIAEAKSLFKE